MRTIDIVAGNYRCFTDAAPLRITLGSGFTALIGPNNSGKSTALKLFHELRTLFSPLTLITNLQQYAGGASLGTSAVAIEDQAEIFANTNERPLTLELSVQTGEENELALVRISADRARTSDWKVELFVGPDRVKLIGGASLDGRHAFIREGGATHVVNWEWLRVFAASVGHSVYIGPFRNAISEGSGTYYDLSIGTSFIHLWDDWKTGSSRKQNDAAQHVTRQLETLFGYSRLEISASPDKKTIQAVVNGKSYRLRELGAGLAQFLIVLGNVAIRRPHFLLIDEPELNLHPALQATFLTTLASYVSEGVVFATHSIGLARTTAERIYSFQPNAEGTLVRPFAQTPHLPEFLGEMSFSTFRELGFSTILLVEGASEVKTVQELLRQVKKDHKVVAVPLGGSQLINASSEHELAELKRLSEDIAVLVDSERASAGAPLPADRQAFMDTCTSLGFRCHATERRATENYFSDTAVKAIKGPKYQALGPFARLSDSSMSWGKHENWRIAAAMASDEWLGTDLGQFLGGL